MIDLRIEWCKSKACADRWSEEVGLLREEMRRVVRFLHHRASGWDAWMGQEGYISPWADAATMEGHQAYAHEQAVQFRVMAVWFAHVWRYVDEFILACGEGEVVPQEERMDD